MRKHRNRWGPTARQHVVDVAHDRARRAMRRYAMQANVEHMPESAGCLFHALALVVQLQYHKERAILQAGTMNWPIVPVELDDGVSPTHYSYQWSPEDERSLRALAAGGMPEMHCWVALPDVRGGTIVDVTTRYLKDNVAAAGLPWLTDDPPPYLWATSAELPPRVRYVPEPVAIVHALRFADQVRPYVVR
jgi:hypothetical protein